MQTTTLTGRHERGSPDQESGDTGSGNPGYRRCIKAALFSALAFPCALLSTAQAAEGVSPSAPSLDAGYMVQLVVGLFIVLGAIMALAWIARRMPGMNALHGQSGGRFRIVAALPLGTRERAVILQVGEQQILIGITPTGINTLHVLAEPLVIDPTGRVHTSGENFAQRLKTALGREER